jgi:hypothetical protein
MIASLKMFAAMTTAQGLYVQLDAASRAGVACESVDDVQLYFVPYGLSVSRNQANGDSISTRVILRYSPSM